MYLIGWVCGWKFKLKLSQAKSQWLLILVSFSIVLSYPQRSFSFCRDTPEVDIVGTNLYQRYVNRLRQRRNNIEPADENSKVSENYDPEIPECRNVPLGATFSEQTVERVESILVCTGVYKPGVEPDKEGDEKNYHGHRDFPRITELYKPTKLVQDVYDAIEYILEKEEQLEAE